jgi:hypothetical protein
LDETIGGMYMETNHHVNLTSAEMENHWTPHLNDTMAKLTSAELSQIWASYQNDTLAKCVLSYFLNHVEDTEIRPVLEHGLQLFQTHIQKLTTIFKAEGNAIPQGFTEEDVNETAPRLFSDNYMLIYVQQMCKLGLNAYSVAVSLSTRKDIHAYNSERLREFIEWHSMANDVLLSKGLYVRPPSIPTQDKVSFVHSNNFLQGWFGKQRPLLSLEITNLFENTQRNALGVATLIGFSQVAESKAVASFMVRGKEIAAKHVEIFGSILREDDIPVPMTWDSEVTTSNVAPFSDKLMMAQTTALIAIGLGYYGTSMATSPRHDIATHYVRLMAEIGKYADDGAKIMIKNGWLEQPPIAPDELVTH